MSNFINSEDPDEIQLNISSGHTVCKGKKDFQTEEYNIFTSITLHPYICTMDCPKFIASSQKEESISIQRVKMYAIITFTKIS